MEIVLYACILLRLQFYSWCASTVRILSTDTDFDLGSVYFCMSLRHNLLEMLSITNPSNQKVYPETKGVPLEEMDLVFGERKTFNFPSTMAL